MFGDGCQQFHCFQMLDEVFDRLNPSAKIVGISNAFSLKKVADFSDEGVTYDYKGNMKGKSPKHRFSPSNGALEPLEGGYSLLALP